MSVIHEALQNVESYMSENESHTDIAGQHDRNTLYKVNKLDINISNSLLFILMASGIFSVAYIIYEAIGNNGSNKRHHGVMYESSMVGSGIGDQDIIDDANLLLEEINFDSLEPTKELENIPSPSISKKSMIEVDAIEGEIVGSNKHEFEDVVILKSNKAENLSYQRSTEVYELKNNNIENKESDIVAEKSNIESDYYVLQDQAYKYIVNRNFSDAVVTLEKILINDSNDYYANINMVLIDIEENNFYEADARLKKLNSLYPFSSRVNQLIALLKSRHYE